MKLRQVLTSLANCTRSGVLHMITDGKRPIEIHLPEIPEHKMTTELHRPTCRVLDIFESLASSSSGMTLTELSRAVSSPASSLTPFVKTLLSRGYLELNPHSMRYGLSPKCLLFSSGFSNNSDAYSFVLEVIKETGQQCLETCQIGILQGGNVLYVGKVDSPEPLRLVSSVGKNVPATCTAIGKALLCHHDKDELLKLYPEGLPKLTASSITDADTIHGQLAEINEGAFAYEANESLDYLRCFALPIHFAGKIDSAISISTPEFRLNEDKKKIILECLRKAQDKIETHFRQIGHGLSSQ